MKSGSFTSWVRLALTLLVPRCGRLHLLDLASAVSPSLGWETAPPLRLVLTEAVLALAYVGLVLADIVQGTLALGVDESIVTHVLAIGIFEMSPLRSLTSTMQLRPVLETLRT